MDKAAIYCRLSKEDYDKINEGDESESITNQKMLLTDYAINHGYYIHDIYVDEDYSGLYHDRPAFDRLIQDAKLKKFNIILAKTQSRFTRNMEHAEKYLHNVFPLLGIRFIGVVDGVDSSMKSNKKARQINGLINEWYSEDLSDNIRAVFREKMSKGQFIGSFACYGYKKDPVDHHKIIIDEAAATVVKRIFQYCCNGYGVNYIAKKLSEDNIPTPTIYKQLQGLKFYNPNDTAAQKDHLWSTTTIKRILNNEMYTGMLIQGREKKLSYKSKKVVLTPKEEWILVPGNHEPIISKEIYKKAQVALKSRRKSCNSRTEPHMFAGKVKCADCRNTMVKTSGKSQRGYDYLICQQSRKSNKQKCTRHSIRYDILQHITEDKLHELIGLIIRDNKDLLLSKLPVIDHKKTIQRLHQSIICNDTEILECKQSLTNLYVDKTRGILNEAEFLLIKETLNQRLDEIDRKVLKDKEELQQLLSVGSYQNERFDRFWQQIIQNELTFDLIQMFIKDIYIGEKIDNHQTIEIHWSF